MVNCTYVYSGKKSFKLKNRVMFRGNSCHPISPYQGHVGKSAEPKEIDIKDQMVKIINTIKPDS